MKESRRKELDCILAIPDIAGHLLRRTIRDVSDDLGCRLYTGHIGSDGYGRYHTFLTHRIWWIAHNGEVPEGTELAHSCHKKACLIHARPKTHDENMKEYAAQVTHCKRGHLYDERNTYLQKGRKLCRTCQREGRV